MGRRSGTGLNKQPMSPPCCLGNIFTVQEIRSITHTVVLGTQALHKEGYSHKDIKTADILFSRGHGLLCDFGLCSQIDQLLQNQFFGTQDYVSSEARRVGCHRECDYIRGDVFSLGAVLYELATGPVLSKVINQGLNWQRIAEFGGWTLAGYCKEWSMTLRSAGALIRSRAVHCGPYASSVIHLERVKL
ncbi:hypothetical protein BGZ80_009910 [Entomortierella chlamydospora]|uniref:Protein kinase domain-containing protein n=1 Tax=Entomortierella chlamydospora TaxID=101097 RepID=A0A9P6T0E4_9FUNG|nr:hypothetical protein BGZ80_009910 [Entomortierella chlamydospora]